MWPHMGVVLFAVAFQISFTAKSSETLHQRYGKPLSETYFGKRRLLFFFWC